MQFTDLQKEMVAALKAGNKSRKESISLVIAAIKKVAIDEGHRDDISEELVNQVLLKEIKSTKEQIDTCPESRVDLLDQYKSHLAVIEEFAPKMLSADEVKAILTEKFADVIASKNKGMIMKTVMAELKGKADGKVISSVVADLCK